MKIMKKKMNKEQIQSELFVSSKQSKIKTKLISFSLAVSNSTTKQNSFRKTSNLKFKTQKSSPEKTILKQNPKNNLNSPLNNLNDKKTINENDNSEKEPEKEPEQEKEEIKEVKEEKKPILVKLIVMILIIVKLI